MYMKGHVLKRHLINVTTAANASHRTVTGQFMREHIPKRNPIIVVIATNASPMTVPG